MLVISAPVWVRVSTLGLLPLPSASLKETLKHFLKLSLRRREKKVSPRQRLGLRSVAKQGKCFIVTLSWMSSEMQT